MVIVCFGKRNKILQFHQIQIQIQKQLFAFQPKHPKKSIINYSTRNDNWLKKREHRSLVCAENRIELRENRKRFLLRGMQTKHVTMLQCLNMN